MSVKDSIEANHHAAAQRSIVVSVCTNLVLSFAQVIIGVVASSQALVSDGIHSLSDLVADFVVLLAGRQSRKGPDEDHPYGHRRFENAASFILGLLLLVVGGGMLWSAVVKFGNPAAIPRVHAAALWVASIALVAKESLFRYMLAVAKRIRSSMLAANAWHARSDAASSLVAALGIIGSLLGYPILDPVAALIVGVMVTRMGWQFAWAALNDLMDRAADEDEVAAIRATLAAMPAIAGFHDLRTRKMGDMIVVDVHLEVNARLSLVEAHDIAAAVQRELVDKHRVLNVMTHIDPVGEPTHGEAAMHGHDHGLRLSS
ncbi:cation diffusion facilitator family transporter [Paraburkholderia sp.]|uniref:cation diffusion facilitator family transporter n=1 Tax=Paraburkholderia sp. TaxID=1926495 RepID=UPI0025F3B06C|nr:cation diffusion facilitator family transporter [Paraburkholderia sp.]